MIQSFRLVVHSVAVILFLLSSPLVEGSERLSSPLWDSVAIVDHPYAIKSTSIYTIDGLDQKEKSDLLAMEPLPSRDLVVGTNALMGSNSIGINEMPLNLSSYQKDKINDLISKRNECCGSCCADCCCVEMEENDLYAYGSGGGGGGGGFGGGGGYGGIGFAGGGGVGGFGGTTGNTGTTTSTTTGTTSGTTTGTTNGILVPEPSTWLIMAGLIACVMYLKARRDRLKEKQ